jgi:hypothetical protein
MIVRQFDDPKTKLQWREASRIERREQPSPFDDRIHR